ncbi:type II toxin-antitoxin system Phd/YefM family antitoxin [Agromyces archimandritae]|uniref:Antitoxin n=1 Tax=Agromyces archimandritae TaxID=2781962 RepID=A0A975FML5_9MICO|nr:type II toxin-antitoxin system Phd/YefM family antitoxin [Agromyces archimandritae]QTX03781.1 type II toxin-antitoxin system Phd/YefM family antitoxin [Agromyces archimandritae]
MSAVSASEARQSLPAQLDRVERGEEIEITRHGRVVAVLVSPDALRLRRSSERTARADELGTRLEQSRRQPVRPVAANRRRIDRLAQAVRDDRAPR